MNKVKIITDSCCSLSSEKLKKLDIDYVSMDITINGKTHNSFEHPIQDFESFYAFLEKSESCSTSCINCFTFEQIFEEYIKDGFDVFYIGLANGMSCSNANAQLVANELNEKYGKHIWVADSLSGSFAVALLLEEAKKMADDGKSAQEIFDALNNNGLKTFAIFAPGDLKFLKRSGRISAFVTSLGTMLKLVPIISANNEGKLKLFSKSIGRKKALKILENFVLQYADLTTNGKIYIGHTGQKEEAKQLANFLKANTQNKEIIIDYIDYTMGCNCGPRTIALFGILK